ncbi:MAG TPA: type II secretion system F family protein [Candidatus Cybelea sp.]|jgi:tight adherence protein B|nr:type II secretion system F family protein [Candidatus Cybelea sp.]
MVGVGSLAPVAIFAGVAATVFCIFYAVWSTINRRATERVNSLADRLDRAGIRMRSQEIVLTVASSIAIVWIMVVFLLHTTLFTSLVLLPVFAISGAMLFYVYVDFRTKRRLDAFGTQLEPAMRLMGGGLRVGLGLRQAMSVVIDELPDPAQYEFRRVIGQTNLGASMFDALDALADRMPSHESKMIARVFRVQSETGGDLAKILDQLADTIKDRRQVGRKVSALTAEGRMSAWVLMAIPIALGLFIYATQETMAHALLYTFLGHIVILIIIVLEVCAYFWLRMILRVNV